MLPKGPLGYAMLKKLKCYAGPRIRIRRSSRKITLGPLSKAHSP